MTHTRIYLVNGPGTTQLIRAPNKAQAIRHAAQVYRAEVATQDDLIAALNAGAKVEEATNGQLEVEEQIASEIASEKVKHV